MTRPMHRTHLGNIATLNLGSGPNPRKIDGLLYLIAWHGVTVIGMQEGSDRIRTLTRLREVIRHPRRVVRRVWRRYKGSRMTRRDLARRATRGRWRVYQPRVLAGAAAVPIAYDAAVWRLLRTRSRVAVARTWVGSKGAGPTWAKQKVVNVAVLRHRATGEVVRHLNTHMIASAERGNLPTREKRARRRHFRKHVRVLVTMIRNARRHGTDVVLTLDANAKPDSPLVEPLHEVGMTGWTQRGTRGARPIDHVLTSPGLDAGPPRVVGLRGFDHRAVVRPLYADARRPHRGKAAT